MEQIQTPPALNARLTEGLLALPDLCADAVMLSGDRSVTLRTLPLKEPGAHDLVVETELSGISTGTEKLFWSGTMPPFPGMGYPLVPGYETVGRVIHAPAGSGLLAKRVFVPGSYSFADTHCLFGGAASRLVVPSERAVLADSLEPHQALALSLAATAYHAIAEGEAPDLIVGFGVVGRLLFRITQALGHPAPQVWEVNPARASAEGITATTAEQDQHKAYRSIYDASGSADAIDGMIGALSKGGTLCLAGFYTDRIGFTFAPAFMKEARIRIAAEWSRPDMDAVLGLVARGRLSLDGLMTHTMPAGEASSAYRQAFTDPQCLKMCLDWRVPRD